MLLISRYLVPAGDTRGVLAFLGEKKRHSRAGV